MNDHWTSGDVPAGALTLHYTRTGESGNPPLLLLHGITDNGLCWSRVARDLAGEFDIVIPDARGHGQSGGIETGFSIDLLGDDVAAIIRALELGSTLVYGHSMGAITAMSLAARYPELVRAAVLEDPPLFDGHRPELPEPDVARAEWQAALQAPRAERIARKRAENPSWYEEEMARWAEAKEQVQLEVVGQRDVFTSYPWREVLARIRCPVLLLTAETERGALVTPRQVREVQRIGQQVRVTQIAGAGHSIHRERYDETMAAVLAFLREQSSTP